MKSNNAKTHVLLTIEKKSNKIQNIAKQNMITNEILKIENAQNNSQIIDSNHVQIIERLFTKYMIQHNFHQVSNFLFRIDIIAIFIIEQNNQQIIISRRRRYQFYRDEIRKKIKILRAKTSRFIDLIRRHDFRFFKICNIK